MSSPENVEELTEERLPFRMLQFEKYMLTDQMDSDGLVITAKGLNDSVVLQNIMKAYNNASHLLIVMNASDEEEKYYSELLRLKPVPNTVNERVKVYFDGGVHFVSTRVLVVDLLRNKIPVEHVNGIIVLRAHRVLESCQEAFALRLFREKNKKGFIKAFSHSPQSFTFGYARVEKVMKALLLNELFLWPRFHRSVSECLKDKGPTVVELHIPVSHNCGIMQICILDLMNYTTKELKKLNRDFDMQEITVENCMARKFHKILQLQLDCVWHQLSVRTKELVQDLKIMRNLILNLIHHNSIQFYMLLSKYRTPEYAKVNSGWILSKSAEELFKLAHRRVFNADKEFKPEIPVKWKYLTEILTVEIPAQRQKCKKSEKCIKVLILCQDIRTCRELNDYLTMGTQKCMYSFAMKEGLQISSFSEEYKAYRIEPTSKGDPVPVASTSTENPVPVASTSKEYPVPVASTSKETSHSSQNEESVFKDDADEDNADSNHFVLTMSQPAMNNESMFESFTQMENMDLSNVHAEAPLIYIQTFKNMHNGFCLENNLHTLKPDYIIMYHCDITATRQIELYEARRSNRALEPLTVYFLMYSQTTEEQAYLTSLRREKEAFELLITAKQSMVVEANQDRRQDIPLNLETEEEQVNTRQAGGQKATSERHIIIVDMREFRSDLPALLHKNGIQVEPVTITVGDYILTPDICVERKSISDLIGSLHSGRLYTQCTQMTRNYKRPILLIEFDQNRPFHFQGQFMLSRDMTDTDIRQKLQLLTLHFPKLKLVWSPSPYATVDLFLELKQGRQQPDMDLAAALRQYPTMDTIHVDRFNPEIYDFMQKLPGITSKNVYRIMNAGVSLDNVVKLSQEELSKMLENENDGKTLWNILHNSYSSLTSHRKTLQKNTFGKAKRGGK